MLKKLETLTKQIEESESLLKEISLEVEGLESKRLNEVIQISLKGLKFDKITSSEREFTPNGFERYSPKYEYFMEDGKYIKGIYLQKISNDDNTGTGTQVDRLELWLLSDGSFMVFHREGYWNRFQGSWSEDTRTIVETAKNIFELNTEWDIDTIVDSIEEGLNSRLISLGKRTKIQQKRLLKLEELTIK